MKIKLTKFSDLGKCSMGTLLDEFDTERDKIFVMVKEPTSFRDMDKCYAQVKITSVDDLAMWLWNISGISSGDENGHSWIFTGCEDWWIREYSRSIKKHEANIVAAKKKLEKWPKRYISADGEITKNAKKWLEKQESTIADSTNAVAAWKQMIYRCENGKKEIIEKLKKENENDLHS